MWDGAAAGEPPLNGKSPPHLRALPHGARATREAFERLARLELPKVTLRNFSMGRSHSYRVAIDEGSNVVRIGTRIFGGRAEESRPVMRAVEAA